MPSLTWLIKVALALRRLNNLFYSNWVAIVGDAHDGYSFIIWLPTPLVTFKVVFTPFSLC